MVTHYQLSNKTHVCLVPQKDAQSATFLIMFPVGSRYETEKLRGVSHFIEHLMFKGTKKRKNTLALTREIDRLGAEYNAFTSKEYTGYYVKVDKKFTRIALDILSDMLYESTFDPIEMEREKKVVVEELKMYKDNPMMNIDNVFEELLFDGSRMGWDIGGTPKHVLSYPREDVIRYRDTYYRADNVNVIVAGAIEDDTKELIETYFNRPGSAGKKKSTYTPAKFGKKTKADRLRVVHKKTDQAQLMIGFPGFRLSDHEHIAPLVMLNSILGGSMSSRLFIRIRERLGLAYMVRSGVEEFQDTGYSYVRAGLDAQHINRAILEIQKEIQKIVTKGVTAGELRDAKTHVRGGTTLSFEDSSALANWYGRVMLFEKKIITPEEWLQKLEAVTLSDIQKVAKQVFRMDEMRIAIIGDVVPKDIRF